MPATKRTTPKQNPVDAEAAIAELQDGNVTFKIRGETYTFPRRAFLDPRFRRLMHNLNTDPTADIEIVALLLGEEQYDRWCETAAAADPDGFISTAAYRELWTALNKAAGVGNS